VPPPITTARRPPNSRYMGYLAIVALLYFYSPLMAISNLKEINGQNIKVAL